MQSFFHHPFKLRLRYGLTLLSVQGSVSESNSTSIMASTQLAGTGLPDTNLGPSILAVVATTILALTTVALRLSVRIGMIRSVGVDGYFIVGVLAS